MWKGKKDSIYTLFENNDTICFYFAVGKVIPIKIVANTSKIIFDNDIKVGITKEYFINRFKTPNFKDTFYIQK